MTYALFIDDERDLERFRGNSPDPDLGWAVARSHGDAVTIMTERGCPAFVSFDHDLGAGPTGHDVAHWIVDKALSTNGWFRDDFSFFVHSANPIGSANISGLLDNFLRFYETRILSVRH